MPRLIAEQRQPSTTATHRRGAAGFSLIELLIALTVTLIVTGLATTLVVASFNVRAREARKSDAIADVRRTLGAMTRELTNAGYGLPGALPTNGIVAADSDSSSIRILSNSDRFSTAAGATPDSPTSPDEDVVYRFINDEANGQRYITRYDVNRASAGATVLADRIDSFVIHYYAQKVRYTTFNCDVQNPVDDTGHAVAELPAGQADQATYVVLSACVQLPAIGQPGQAGYQPGPIWQQLTSDVQLRNANISAY